MALEGASLETFMISALVALLRASALMPEKFNHPLNASREELFIGRGIVPSIWTHAFIGRTRPT